MVTHKKNGKGRPTGAHPRRSRKAFRWTFRVGDIMRAKNGPDQAGTINEKEPFAYAALAQKDKIEGFWIMERPLHGARRWHEDDLEPWQAPKED